MAKSLIKKAKKVVEQAAPEILEKPRLLRGRLRAAAQAVKDALTPPSPLAGSGVDNPVIERAEATPVSSKAPNPSGTAAVKTQRLSPPLAPVATLTTEPKGSEAEVPKEVMAAGAVTMPKAATLPFHIPPILLEGDEPMKVAIPDALPLLFSEAHGQVSSDAIPIHATARDQRTIYAHWELSPAQLRRYNALAGEHHLSLRVRLEHGSGIESQVDVHPESNHWFVHVAQAGAAYVCEIGYLDRDGIWHGLGHSNFVRTPPDAPSSDETFTLGTVAEVRNDWPRTQSAAFLAPAQPFAGPSVATESAITHGDFPQPAQHPPPPFRPAPELPFGTVFSEATMAPAQEWSAAYTEQLNALSSGRQVVTREFIDSEQWLKVEESLRPRPAQAPTITVSSIESAQPLVGELVAPSFFPSSLEGSIPPALPGPSFWFNVNAELIIYGSTDPAATVTIGGKPIRLRKDGSFSYRFILPDGYYELPVVATAAFGDTRRSELRFSRSTVYTGEVGTHPQDATLKAPSPEHIS